MILRDPTPQELPSNRDLNWIGFVAILFLPVALASASLWSIVPSANPGSNSTSSQLFGISCSSPVACMAVGESDYSNGAVRSLAEWWNGRTWTLLPRLRSGPTASLTSVSCVEPGFCTVVGLGAEGGSSLFASWNGLSWTSIPVTIAGLINAISCVSLTDCTAAGQTRQGDRTATFVEMWRDGRWSSVESSSGASASDNTFLSGVSCISSSFCLAIGGVGPNITRAPTKTLAEVWNGRAWKLLESPNEEPSVFSNNLESVSCASRRYCIAVGSVSSQGKELTLSERWNGSSFSLLASPSRSTNRYVSALRSVSCFSSRRCVAVGNYYEQQVGFAYTHTLGESWNGVRWSLEPTPDEGSFASYLDGVWCTASDTLTVGGWGFRSSTTYRTLVEKVDGDGSVESS
jgi:hypothetical protein